MMHIDAEVNGQLTEADDMTGQQLNIVDITGDDLAVLIGPRGGTLDSLQYISRLMVSHQLPIWVARMSFERRRFLHDPRSRECGLGSVTSFTVMDGVATAMSYATPAEHIPVPKYGNGG